MKTVTVVEQIERLEDQLQAIKWAVRSPQLVGRVKSLPARSIVAQTAGLLRGRLPQGRTYQHRLRHEWERRLKREAAQLAKYLIDTNILIDHLRGDPAANQYLRDVEAGRVRATISVITECELLTSPVLTQRDERKVIALLELLPRVAVTSRIARSAA